MAEANTSHKLPNTDIKVTYPYCQTTVTVSGHETIHNNTKDEELVRIAHTRGTFVEWSKTGGERRLVANTKHEVVSQGQSVSVEGPSDHYVMNHERKVNMGDGHRETSGNDSHVLGGAHVRIAKGDSHVFHNDGKSSTMTGDDHINYVGDDDSNINQHSFHQGDHSSFTGGNRYEVVNGEKGTYLPDGNMDIQLDNGKLRIKSSKDMSHITDQTHNVTAKEDINIKADKKVNIDADEVTITGMTKITIKVGNSKIVITQNSIDIISDGDITTRGQTTKVQGGGLKAPPTTFQ